jgi:signal transduction histidine kinase
MSQKIFEVELRSDRHVVESRQRAREISELLGFDRTEQVRLATATSEMARNAYRYATAGRVIFSADLQGDQALIIEIADKGTGIPHLNKVLSGRYRSTTGLGMGIIGTKRLMDHFEIDAKPTGTSVCMKKRLPSTAPPLTPELIRSVKHKMERRAAGDPMQEMQVQNRELLGALAELRARQEDLQRVNEELEDTNRGVVALYAELDERADFLRRASELKSTFLSHVSHEFRTPLNSITALTDILLARADGELTAEQEKQVRFIRSSADDLYEMVNDLLDLAKVEAGRIDVRPTEFQLNDLLNGLRGVLKPLLAANRSLDLVIDPADDIPVMYSDDAKIAQILRNFISNAIKFTEKGEVRVSSRLNADGSCVIIAVSDTGIGIAKENLPLVFEEFAQVDSPLQRKVKGTGLGLPLAKKFASLLGGTISVKSELGHGSTFTVELPLSLAPRESEREFLSEAGGAADEAGFQRVLLVDDDPQHRYVLRSVLGQVPEVIEADSVHAGFAAAKEHRPELIFIDLIMQGASGFDLIRMLDANPETRRIPRIVNTSKLLNEEERDFLEANAVGVLDKRTLTAAEGKMAMHRALARATAQAKSA